jgi:hypothetical protein
VKDVLCLLRKQKPRDAHQPRRLAETENYIEERLALAEGFKRELWLYGWALT